jgi:hypothetical protein
VSPLYRGVSLSCCEPSKPQSDATSYSHGPATYSQTWLFLLAVLAGCSCWLLFCVVPAALQPKTRGFLPCIRASSLLFSVHISENSDGLGSGRELR